MASWIRALFPAHFVDVDNSAARDAHLDRNEWQQDQVPTHMPQDINCVVDPHTGVSWVHDGPLEHTVMSALDLHQVDTNGDGVNDTTADNWRGLLPLDARNALVSDPHYQDDVHALAGSSLAPDAALPSPGLQADYHPITGELMGGGAGGTFDYASPLTDLGEHRVLDVGPHDAFGGNYTSFDQSDHQDLSGIGPHDALANEGACRDGAYAGSSSLYGDVATDHGGNDTAAYSGAAGDTAASTSGDGGGYDGGDTDGGDQTGQLGVRRQRIFRWRQRWA